MHEQTVEMHGQTVEMRRGKGRLVLTPGLPLGLVLLVGVAACSDSEVVAPDLAPLTLAVIGDVTIDSINPAYGQVGLLDPSGNVLVTAVLQDGQYRVTQQLEPGVNVCDGFEMQARITEDTGTRTLTRRLVAASGDCVVSPDMGIKHFVDLDFPFLLGGPAVLLGGPAVLLGESTVSAGIPPGR